MNNKNDKIFSSTETKSQQVQKRRIDEATADIIQIMAVSKRRFDHQNYSPSNLEKPFIDDWLSMFEHLQSVIEPYLQIDFLSFLPKELSLKIINYLSPSDLALSASGVSRFWRSLAEDKLLWAEKCRQFSISEMFPPNQRFTPPKRSFASERSRWKAIYLRNLRISNNWRLRRPTAVCQLRGHDEHVITCLKLRGDLIVTGSDDCTLRVWSAATGTCVHILNGHIGGVWALQLSQDGEIAVSGSTDRTVRCMSLRKNILVTGSRDCSIKIWDIVDGKCIRTLYGHLAAPMVHWPTCWKATRTESIHSTLDTTIRVWKVDTGECMQTLVGHHSLTSGMKLRENILVSANADSTIKVWNILDGTCVHTFAGPNKHVSAVTGLRFLSNGMVATSGDDGFVKLWNVKEGTFVCDLLRLTSRGVGGCVWRMKATPTLLICAVGSRNGTEDTKLVLMDFDSPYP
uniref:F-box domain-containing protein n=1 Tax=Globodera pallida TaxID=36090 RepID=A0A183BYI6_GLOPA